MWIPYQSVCDLVSVTKCLPDFSVGLLYKMSLSKHEFFENWQGERHVALKGVYQDVPIFSSFCI